MPTCQAGSPSFQVGFNPSADVPPTAEEAQKLLETFGGRREQLNRALSAQLAPRLPPGPSGDAPGTDSPPGPSGI